MKKTIAIVLAFICCTMVMAQDTYRSLVTQQFAIEENNLIKENLAKLIAQAAQAKGLSEDKAKEATMTYWNEKVEPMMIDVYEKYYSENLTIEEVKQYNALIDNPATRKSISNVANIFNQENVAKLVNLMMPMMLNIQTGQEIESIPQPQVPASYKQKFEKMYNLLELKGIMDSKFAEAKKLIPANDEKNTKIIDNIIKFFNNNFENMILHVIYPSITEEDMDNNIKIYSTPIGKKVQQVNIKANEEIAQKTQNAAKEILESIK